MNTINIIGWTTFGVLVLFNLCYSAYKHGQPRGNWSFWVTLIAGALDFGLLCLVAWK
jgi:hypothetical protein